MHCLFSRRSARLNNEPVVGNRSRSSSSSGSNTPGHTDHHQQQQPGSVTASRQRSSSTSGGAGGQQQHQGVFIRGADRRVLQNLRVIQRTLVYAIGLTPTIAQASTLKEVNRKLWSELNGKNAVGSHVMMECFFSVSSTSGPGCVVLLLFTKHLMVRSFAAHTVWCTCSPRALAAANPHFMRL